jgi:hypothetical protein
MCNNLYYTRYSALFDEELGRSRSSKLSYTTSLIKANTVSSTDSSKKEVSHII